MAILCLVQLDPATQEATGTVVPFCSEKCRHEAKSSLDYPDHTDGVSDAIDFGFVPHCEQCGAEMEDAAPAVANQPSVQAAEAALKAHENALGIDGGVNIQVWHLLVSLHEYCAARGVDFDTELAEVKNGIASGELDVPACYALAKKKPVSGASKLSM